MGDAYKEGSVDFLVCYAIDLYITVQSKFNVRPFLQNFYVLSFFLVLFLSCDKMLLLCLFFVM